MMQSYKKKTTQLKLAEEALVQIEKIAKYQFNKQILDVIDEFWKEYFKLECPRTRQ